MILNISFFCPYRTMIYLFIAESWPKMQSNKSTKKSSTDWWIWKLCHCIPIKSGVWLLEHLMHWCHCNHSIWLPIHSIAIVIWHGLQTGWGPKVSPLVDPDALSLPICKTGPFMPYPLMNLDVLVSHVYYYRPGQPNWENTMWKFQDFYATQNSCEINFGDFEAPQNAVLNKWAALNFEF